MVVAGLKNALKWYIATIGQTQNFTKNFTTLYILYIQGVPGRIARLRENVPYVKLYRYNPKHIYPKLNGYGDNGQRSLKLWQLLHTYWLQNSYLNWKEYVVSVMLISVLNIKLTCELHKAIKLNYKNTRTHVIVVLRFTKHFTCAVAARNALSRL